MLLRLLLSLASGLMVWLAFPRFDLWFLAIFGMGLLSWVLLGVGAKRGALLGFVAGLALFIPLLSWSGIYVGALPWIALATLSALYVAIFGLLAGYLQSDRGLLGTARVRPVAVGLAWVAAELARSTTPFGGFPWARLGFSQADSPIVGVARWLGVPGVSFVVVVIGATIALVAQSLLVKLDASAPGKGNNVESKSRFGVAAVASLAVVALLLGPLLIPRPIDGDPVNVLGVQGNVPELTLEFNAQRRAVLDNHANGTLNAAELVAQGEIAQPDLVIWPENASDIDPIRNGDAAVVIDEALTTIDAPLIVGAVLQEPEGYVSNASLLYVPGEGIVDRYVKQRPVPFAEYIPYRDFFRFFSDKVDLVTTDFAKGEESGLVTVPLASGDDLPVGIGICFEVVIDDVMRQSVLDGAQIMAVPTNNATFGLTDESEQQLAASRVKAIELGRPIVHISTVGVSGLVSPDGSVTEKTELFTAGLISGEIPRRTEITPAVRWGFWPQGIALAGLAALIAGVSIRRADND